MGLVVSIHAPARGATEEYDRAMAREYVSIHAPARGATAVRAGADNFYEFQSTHPHGVRLSRFTHGEMPILFQSTHPHGVRPSFPKRSIIHGGRFNPRTRTGCDGMSVTICRRSKGFNPRTRTGCDSPMAMSFLMNGCFNPRTRTGCDPRLKRPDLLPCCFNPRTRTGCDSK